MTLSMTAFARRDRDTQWGGLAWELRSVNHRYLEMSLRLPEELRSLEPAVRELLGRRLGRGKVDASLRFQARDSAGAELSLDEDQIARVLAAGRRVAELAGGGVGILQVAEVLRWPGVLKSAGPDVEALAGSALELLDQAVEDLILTRRREGERLAALIRERLDAIQGIVTAVRVFMPEVVTNYRQRLDARLAELRAELDPSRLEQEMVLFSTRIDVAEELDRLATHLDEVRRVLGQTGQVGRRLDFLMQEFNREANTLASKAADLRMTNAGVDLKVLIEQMREQIQNIE